MRARIVSVWTAALAALLLHPASVLAIPVGAPLEFDNEEQQALYQEVVRELRCTVCQNQSLIDSSAGLASDLRRNTYEMVRSGAKREEIMDYMVSRYGEFVLYRPPLKSHTLVLWFSPAIFLAAGGIILAFAAHRLYRVNSREQRLTERERQRLAKIISTEEGQKT